MTKEVFFDTNILVYSVDTQSPFNQKSKELLKSVVSGSLNLLLSYQSLNEFFRVVTSRKLASSPFSAKEAIRAIIFFENVSKVVFPTAIGSRLNFELAKKYHISSVKIFDNMLVATMLEYGVFNLYTNNVDDFLIYEEIVVTNPLA